MDFDPLSLDHEFQADGDFEDELGPDANRKKREALMILVEMSEALMEGQGFARAIQSVQTFMKAKLFACDQAQIGLLLYGTQVAQNALHFENVYVVQDLAETSIQRVKDLDALVALTPEEVASKIGRSQFDKGAALGSALWCATSCFFESKIGKTYGRTVYLMVGEEAPCEGPALKSVKARLMDMVDSKVDIRVVPVHRAETEDELAAAFDPSKFWEPILGDSASISQLMLNQEDFNNPIKVRNPAQRALLNSRLVCGDLEVGITLYSLLQVAKPPLTKWVSRKTNEILRQESNLIDTVNGKYLHAADLRTFAEVGVKKERIYMEKAEFASRAAPEHKTTHLELLGFRNADEIGAEEAISHPVFAVPNDKTLHGSTEFMASLVQTMVSQRRVGVVRRVRRGGAPIYQYFYMFPQEQQTDANDCITHYLGLHLMRIPYTNESRPISVPPSMEMDQPTFERGVELTREILSNYEAAADIEQITMLNPELQHFYAYLEKLAFGQEEIPEEADELIPSHEIWYPNKPEYEAWNQFHYQRSFLAAPLKRPVSEVSTRASTTDGGPEVVGQLPDKFTVPQLKAYCTANSLDTSGKKADLVSRIRLFQERQM